MRTVIIIIGTFAGLTGTVFGLPPGLSDPCTNSPCGRGAKCQTMTAIAVCTCPIDSTGDPFVDCNLISGQRGQPIPSQELFSTSQSTLSHFASSMPISSNAGLSALGTILFSKSPSLSTTTSNSDDYRIPIRGPSYFTTTDSSPSINTERLSNSGGMAVREPITVNLGQVSNHLHKFPLHSPTRYPQHNLSPFQGKLEPDLTLNSFVKDPMGQYSNCRTVNDIVVCADNSVDNILPVTTSHQSGNDNRFQELVVSHSSQKYLDQHQITDGQSIPIYQAHGQQNIINHKPNIQDRPVGNLETGQVHFNLPAGSNESLCKSMCGINSICRLFLGRPVCGCAEGQTGDPSIKCEAIVEESKQKSSCEKHIDCSSTEICLESKCTDPCSNTSLHNMPPVINVNRLSASRDTCGKNAKCLVIEHTPLCGCMDGFYGNPYIACVN